MSFSVRKLDGLCGVILVPCDWLKCQLGLESSEGSTGLDVLTHMPALVPGWQLRAQPRASLWPLQLVVSRWLGFLHYGYSSQSKCPKTTRWKPMAFSSLVSEVPWCHSLCTPLVEAVTSLLAFKGRDMAPESGWEGRPGHTTKKQVGWVIL